MSLPALLVVSAALFGVGVYGALSQQTFVMIMMGLELMLSGAMLAAVALWAAATGGNPKGQLLTVVAMTVMAVEAAMGFALVIGIYRIRRADMTEKIKRLRG
ncbi:MAG TPA: NADH-quinone oxidoreductase subunit NuoK [Acidimicrobiales bacterium]|nr:NADH-quinone oxidoreductase subunit NuoK [Acidimicrobiales bacterium]